MVLINDVELLPYAYVIGLIISIVVSSCFYIISDDVTGEGLTWLIVSSFLWPIIILFISFIGFLSVISYPIRMAKYKYKPKSRKRPKLWLL